MKKQNSQRVKTIIKCCPKDLLSEKEKPKPPPLPPIKEAKNCELPPKPEKLKKEHDKAKYCPRASFVKTPEEKRAYLDNNVVPILMEGMMAVAREKPDDPITYLSKFWLQNQQECDEKLPDDILG